MDEEKLFEAIYARVKQIPAGQVMSYGQVGQEIGCSAREVGGAMQQVHGTDVPWQRVVGTDGYLRIGRRSVVLQQEQRELLEGEGVTFKENGYVEMSRHRSGVIGKPQTLELALE